MTEPTAPNPALSDAPEESIGITEIRSRLSVAFAVHGNELQAEARALLAVAIGTDSKVDAIVAAFDVLSANAEDCGPVLLSRAIEVAELIALHGFHGMGDAAATFAANARAAL